MTITIDDYCFSVDVDKTAAYYQNNTLCDCAACRNYRQQIAEALPSAAEWLRQFGADITRPDETAWVQKEDGTIDYIDACYTVCGKIEKHGKLEFDFKDKIFTSAVVISPEEDGGYFPNEQQGDYFGIIFYDITLPWVLEEPLPDEKPLKKQSRKTPEQRVFDRIKAKLKKKQ